MLIGATKLHQLQDNLGAMNVLLTQEDIDRLDMATALTSVFPDGTQPDRVTARALAGRGT